CHDARDHARAVEALAAAGAPLDHLPHLLRYLDCLAHLGDADAYRRAVAEGAALLGVVPPDATDPAPFLARVRPAVARVEVALADGRLALGSGLLVGGRLVATGRRLLVRDAGGGRKLAGAGQVRVWLGGTWRGVEAVVPHGSGLVDVALLRLASPA